MDILPWERLLWSGRPAFRSSRDRYLLTDFRLVRISGGNVDEIVLGDIAEIRRIESRLDQLMGTSTLIVYSRAPTEARRPQIVLRRVRRAQQLAALLEWLSGEPGERHPGLDADEVRAALAWSPRTRSSGYASAIAVAAVLVAVFGVAIGLHGKTPAAPTYSPDDSIYPNGHKRTRAEIVSYMEREVMPWARAAIGPLKGGRNRITCESCHGRNPESREWRMPAVAALPEPEVRDAGWERYGGGMDAQMRNAIYGYAAESDKQTKATYMREIVMPGMARLLGRPAYDFTRPYGYNRARLAFGCYHCHRVN